VALTEVPRSAIATERQLRAAISRLCEPGAIKTVVQPIVRTSDMAIVGYEALARMPIEPLHPPDWWLEQASSVGLRHKLEMACLRAAANLGHPPGGRALFVNASPSLVADPAVLKLRDALPQRLVVELTEQEAVDDYPNLRERLGGWLASGVRLAVDDAGAGYSSLRHVVELAPDYLKVDRELVRDLDSDPTRQALLRAIVAFSHEVGTSVIAEGVETAGELSALRDAKVHLVQGYLLARPDVPWPSIARGAEQAWSPRVSALSSAEPSFDRFEQLRLSLGRIDNVVQACETVVEHIFRCDRLMTSLYLERDRQLRCVAQRGLWQVLDGLPGSVGITGLTWAEKKTIVAYDVSAHERYLQAIPGVVAEICVPITVNGEAVGALNVESLSPLSDGVPEVIETAAGILGERLAVIGISLGNTRWQQAAMASASVSGLTISRRLPHQVLHRLKGAAEMDSASLVVDEHSGPRTVATIGPLGGALMDLPANELRALSSLVAGIRSCYTADDVTGVGFVGTETLRIAGARAVIVLPLWARHVRFGTLVLAHSRPTHLTVDRVEPLELLTDHIASVLAPMLCPESR